jgi:hypothetical protein
MLALSSVESQVVEDGLCCVRCNRIAQPAALATNGHQGSFK